MIGRASNIIRKEFSLLDTHTLEVFRKSTASMTVKVIGMSVGIGVSIFLGRTIGAEGLGIINTANRIVSIILVFSMLGMENVLVKGIAIAYERKDNQSIKNHIYTASQINGFLALGGSILGILISPLLCEKVFHSSELEGPLLIAFAVVIPQTFSRVFAAGVRGFRKIWQSSIVDNILSVGVVGFALLILSLIKIDITVIRVAIIYGIGRMITTLTIMGYWRRLFKVSFRGKWIGGQMIKMALPLLVVSATSVIASNTDIIMLGWLSNFREVGLYSVAFRLALLVSIFLQVTNAAISPKIASLFADGKTEEITKMVNRVTGGLIVIALTSLTVFILFGKPILSLWGSEFKDSFHILIILGIGQFFNISTGCSGGILIMCGHEKIHGYISLISVIMNIVLNYFFITLWGALGAAFATALTISLANITKLVLAKRKTGILVIPHKRK